MFFIVKKSPPVTFAKHLFCKNGFAKRKNEHTATAVQEYLLFAWFYYSTKFYFVNRFLKKILGFHRINFSIRRKPHSKTENRSGSNENIRLQVNTVTGRGYNPSVAPKARQLPLHRGAENRHQLLLCTPALFSSAQILCISPLVFCCRKAATKSSFAPSPPAAHASASLFRVRGRQRLAASLHPPPAALESQTPQREPRALPRRTQICRGGFCIASNSIFRTQKSALAGAFVRIAYSSGKGTRAV